MTTLATTEKAGYNAKAGQVIVGNLARGGDGQFTSAGNASTSYTTPLATKRAKLLKRKASGKAKPKAGSKPKGVDPAKAQERAARIAERKQKAQERATVQVQKKADALVKQAKREQDQAAKKADRAAAGLKRSTEQSIKKQAIDQRRADAAKKKEERQAGGGKGGGAAPKADKAIETARNHMTVQSATLPKESFDTLNSLSQGGAGDPSQLAELVKTGLVEQDTSGAYRLSTAGRSYVTAANAGDVGRANDAMSRARDRVAARVERQNTQTARALVRAQRRNTQKAKTRRATKEAAPMLTVLKQANGTHRWVSVSSTAFQDRDGQIVSRKALQDDCDRADATGKYGTLNWWHTPIVLGDCDFNMMLGRSLIESGTFRNGAIAHVMTKQAGTLRKSIGFRHPLSQPENGVFTYIKRFERSILPAGTESNLFTTLTVKDGTMATTKEKVDALRDLLGDDELLTNLLGTAALTEKQADDAGIQFKAAADDAGAVTEEDVAAADDDMLLSDGELDAIADRVVAKLAPLLQAAVTKEATVDLAPLFDELATLKQAHDTELAVLKTKYAGDVDGMEMRLKELEGTQPAARPFRASQSRDTVTTKTTDVPTHGISTEFFAFAAG